MIPMRSGCGFIGVLISVIAFVFFGCRREGGLDRQVGSTDMDLGPDVLRAAERTSKDDIH